MQIVLKDTATTLTIDENGKEIQNYVLQDVCLFIFQY